MKYSGYLKSGMIFLLLALVGCGGGGGSSAGNSGGVPNQPPTTKINGIASKGPINGGTVTAYKIVNNAKGDVIVSGSTGADGSYTLDLGSYSGPVLLEISGGTYTDEATGNTNSSIPTAAPLHAVVSSASGTVSVAITPFTELAYQLAGTTLSSSAINSANKQVSEIFKVYDIIKIQPVSPIKSVLDALPTSIQGQDQRDYTLALALFSQVASSQGKSVADTISYLKNNISSAALSTVAAAAIQNAAATFFSVLNPNNKTGVTDFSSTNLSYIGGKQVIVKLATTGTIPSGNSIKGMQFELNLPTGVTVRSDANGVLSSYLLTGVASTSTSLLIGHSTSSKILFNFTDSNGITIGEFATLICDVSYNVTLPTSSSFSLTSGYKVVDLIANSGTVNLSAVTIAVSSVNAN